MHVVVIIAGILAAWFLVAVAAALLIGPALKWLRGGGGHD